MKTRQKQKITFPSQASALANRPIQNKSSAQNHLTPTIQTKLAFDIHHSPRLATQRKQLSRVFGIPATGDGKIAGSGQAQLLPAFQGKTVLPKQLTAPPSDPVAQRLIAYNTLGTPHTDYAIMKVIQQLRKKDHGGLVPLTGATDFSGMGEGEKLYIASHGSADTGDLAGLNTDTLIGWLNQGDRGVPDHFGGIVILSCYGGEAIQDESLAERVANGLNVGGKPVEGARGFGFGTPLLADSGKSSVLSQAHRVFYMADDIAAMKLAWAAMNPNHAGGILASRLDYVNEYTSIQNNILNIPGVNNPDQANGWIDSYIKKFKQQAKMIEASLRALLADIPGADVAEKIERFENPSTSHKKVKSWNKLIHKQYELFNDYYLWTPEDDAYESFDS